MHGLDPPPRQKSASSYYFTPLHKISISPRGKKCPGLEYPHLFPDYITITIIFLCLKVLRCILFFVNFFFTQKEKYSISKRIVNYLNWIIVLKIFKYTSNQVTVFLLISAHCVSAQFLHWTFFLIMIYFLYFQMMLCY